MRSCLYSSPSGTAGQSNADQVDKATVRASRTVLGLLTSFTITYSFWLVGFYMQVHATNGGKILYQVFFVQYQIVCLIIAVAERSNWPLPPPPPDGVQFCPPKLMFNNFKDEFSTKKWAPTDLMFSNIRFSRAAGCLVWDNTARILLHVPRSGEQTWIDCKRVLPLHCLRSARPCDTGHTQLRELWW